MTDARGGTISSIEGKDRAVVYRDWVHTGGGIMYSWHFIFSVLPCHFCLLTGGESEMLVFFFSIMPLSPSKCNSDWAVVGGHLKWTPQRPCLGNEIALAMAFCHVAPQRILMTTGTWLSTALQDSHSDTSLIRLAAHSLSLSVICLLRLFPACFLISLL